MHINSLRSSNPLWSDYPTFTIPQTTVTGTALGSVILTVSIAANPALTSVQWRKRGEFSNVYFAVDTSTGKYDGGTLASPSLRINSLASDDVGNYTVIATNALGSQQSSDIVVIVSCEWLTPDPLPPLPISPGSSFPTVLYSPSRQWGPVCLR